MVVGLDRWRDHFAERLPDGGAPNPGRDDVDRSGARQAGAVTHAPIICSKLRR